MYAHSFFCFIFWSVTGSAPWRPPPRGCLLPRVFEGGDGRWRMDGVLQPFRYKPERCLILGVYPSRHPLHPHPVGLPPVRALLLAAFCEALQLSVEAWCLGL